MIPSENEYCVSCLSVKWTVDVDLFSPISMNIRTNWTREGERVTRREGDGESGRPSENGCDKIRSLSPAPPPSACHFPITTKFLNNLIRRPNAVAMLMLAGLALGFGMSVNNAIILVDHINQLRRRGLEKTLAIIEGTFHRLQPVLMTSLTTIAGMLPMVAWAETTDLWYALALVTIGGMASSTLLVLLVVPALYRLASA